MAQHTRRSAPFQSPPLHVCYPAFPSPPSHSVAPFLLLPPPREILLEMQVCFVCSNSVW